VPLTCLINITYLLTYSKAHFNQGKAAVAMPWSGVCITSNS